MRLSLPLLLVASLLLSGSWADDKKEETKPDPLKTAADKKLDERKVSPDFKEQTLKEVLTWFWENGIDVNVVTDPGLDQTTKITYSAQNVTGRKALQDVLEKLKGEMTWWHGVFYLAPKEGAKAEPPAPDFTDDTKKLESGTVPLSNKEKPLGQVLKSINYFMKTKLSCDDAVKDEKVTTNASVKLVDAVWIICRLTGTKVEKDVFKKAK